MSIKKLSSIAMSVLTVRSTGPAMLVTKLAEQALRPKRIASLALPLAALGGPVTAGVRLHLEYNAVNDNIDSMTCEMKEGYICCIFY